MSRSFDHASTTPLLPGAREAMIAALDAGLGDPSRLYGSARRARILLDDARASVAACIGGRAEEVVFTSGGTESCVLGVVGAARAARAARKPARVVVSPIEHTAVLDAARGLAADGFEVIETGVDAAGRVDLDSLRTACSGGAAIVSVQTANPEIGTMQPIEQVAQIAHAAGALLHTDAVMTVGRIPTDVAAMGVDLLSMSAHKAYGPPGAGALWVRRGVSIRPTMVGDDRERRRRAGFENLPAIAGMAAALRERIDLLPEEGPRLAALGARLREGVLAAVPDVLAHGDPVRSLPGLVAFSVLYVEGEALLLGLDAAGFEVHSGSSCTSSTQEPSHVLAAIGALTHGSVRVCLGAGSTEGDVDAFLQAFPPLVGKARALL